MYKVYERVRDWFLAFNLALIGGVVFSFIFWYLLIKTAVGFFS